jgi:hypothetical protein
LPLAEPAAEDIFVPNLTRLDFMLTVLVPAATIGLVSQDEARRLGPSRSPTIEEAFQIALDTHSLGAELFPDTWERDDGHFGNEITAEDIVDIWNRNELQKLENPTVDSNIDQNK